MKIGMTREQIAIYLQHQMTERRSEIEGLAQATRQVVGTGQDGFVSQLLGPVVG